MVGVGERRDRIVVELEGDLLGHASGVGEEQRRVVALDDVLEAVRQRFPDLLAVVRGGASGFREADPEVDRLLGLRFDDRDGAPGATTAVSADVLGDVVEGPNGGGQGDPLEFAGDLDQPFKAGHQLDAPTVLNDSVDLVEDHRLNRRKRLPSAHGGQQQVQALRGRDQQLRRPAEHALAFAGFGVAAAGLHAELGNGAARVRKPGADLGNRSHQVRPDVVVQRLERRYVDHARRAGFRRAGGERVDCPQECRKSLAAARWCGDQHVCTGGDLRPAPGLDVGRRSVGGREPAADLGIELFEYVHRRAAAL